MSTNPILPVAGESFILTYTFDAVLYSPNFVPADVKVAGPSVAETKSEWLIERLIGSKVTLQMASAEFRPLEPQILDKTLTIAWSVNFKTAAKEHLGFLSITSDSLPNGGGIEEVRLKVSAIENPIDWWVLIGSAVGVLVAAANLVTFYWKLKDRQSQPPLE